MVLATLFVTLPLVAGQLIPVLEEMDLSQEEAARSLGATDMQVPLSMPIGSCPSDRHVPFGLPLRR